MKILAGPVDHPPFVLYDVCIATVSSGLDWSGHINLVWLNSYWSKVVSSCLVWSRPSSLVQSGVVWRKDFKWALIIWTQSTTILAKRRQTNERWQPCDPRASLLLTSQKHYLAILYSRSCCWWDTRQELLHKSCGMWLVMCGMWYVTCHMSSVSQVIS